MTPTQPAPAATGRCVVVGASMGGLRAAEAVRKAGFTGEIVVVGEEPHMPYNRPPLSKEALGGGLDPAALRFRIPRAAGDVTWRLGERVAATDLAARTVTLENGDVLAWTGLVVACGLRPRRLAVPGPPGGRHVIRTIEDVQRLRDALSPGARLAVVGAGFIGCEVAATARELGVEVDVIAPTAVPVERPLRRMLGAALQRRHEARGVRFHLGVAPVEFRGGDHVTSLLLGDGTELPADVVVEAVGCVPNVEWLDGNGLDLTDGVLCDDRLRVEGRADVVACGDIARFPNPLFGGVPRRVEHWSMVTETARRAGHTLGRALTGAEPDPAPFAPIPSFWSDQYGMRIQSFGVPDLGAEDVRVLDGDLDDEVAVGYHRDGRLMGVVLIGLRSHYMRYRALIAENAEHDRGGAPVPQDRVAERTVGGSRA
ncbi:FAD/NAD(P)-binding oxidoreductase [Actinomadura viridis]|uniref:NADPH-dependent 2,4-dienoyl-CoA reductase/sulfur reductase-like enzyme n=1 Tax=Actinomadura viridis TaxID=58110 RepID=A0A931GG63_9ACTN|nr:FAD-dependent oxidoreductase [Actinomadura viridis]MBG6086000.1 NADPH-dependent 2,4-dienoyl-CoA reductase/sulfur reductase-like enzyme [Actinomadura viridis]